MADQLKDGDGYFHEATDRLHVALCNLEEHIEAHPAVQATPEAKAKVESAGQLLAEAYQLVGARMHAESPSPTPAPEQLEYSKPYTDVEEMLVDLKSPSSVAMTDAHEIWAAAQLLPGEGIEDGVRRIERLLQSSPTASSTAQEASKQGAWRERWHGSAPYKGWSIVDAKTGRETIAYLGGDESMSDAVMAFVMAHNAALSASPSEADKRGAPAKANSKWPERIYVSSKLVTWSTSRFDKKSVEYIRADLATKGGA